MPKYAVEITRLYFIEAENSSEAFDKAAMSIRIEDHIDSEEEGNISFGDWEEVTDVREATEDDLDLSD